MQRPVLSLKEFSHAYDGSGEWVLKGISFEAYPGQCHCVSGPNGCGKTTLLKAIRGLLPHGRQSGQCATADAGSGIVLQEPEIQLLGVQLGAEVAFGLENHCIAPHLMRSKVQSTLKTVGLGRPLDTPVAKLSMGQQYRACLAGILVMGPKLILMDEPVSQLDPQGLERLKAVIEDLKRGGRAFVICDHRPDALAPVIDHHWRLDQSGRLFSMDGTPLHQDMVEADTRALATRQSSPESEIPHRKVTSGAGGPDCSSRRTMLRLDGVVLHPSAPFSDRSTLSFELSRGETAVVCGPNGSGKTTLVRCLAGLEQPCKGTIEVFNKPPNCSGLRGQVGVLFQNPGTQLFETTVFEEVAFAARRWGSDPFREEQIHRLLEALNIAPLAQIPPHRLSYGQKRLVGLAAVAAANPEMLILDDPLAGLDREHTRSIIRFLTHLNTTQGTTILCTSHHPDFPADWNRHILQPADPEKSGPDNGKGETEAEGTARGWLPLPAGPALLISAALSMAAFAVRSTPMLVALTGINLLLLLLFCPTPVKVLAKSAKLFFWQALIISALYGFRFGWHDGFFSGTRVAWQLFNALWPGLIVSSAISFSKTARALSRVLPDRTAFVVAACVRFLPMLLVEMASIRQAQLFRGARLMPGDLKNPRFWPDWIRCLMVPTLVRALSLSADISTAATARDFGRYPKRTHWPEER